jgi:glutathione S-transferase
MAQIISVVDSYIYWPLVQQVFSHRVVRPRLGSPADGNQISAGLGASAPVLAALENLVSGQVYLAGAQITLADFHLAAMIDNITMTDEGAALLGRYKKLQAWWSRLAQRSSVAETRPVF